MTRAALGAALAADGRTSEADGILRELDQAAAQGRSVSGVWEAAIHTAFGNSDRALACLERGPAGPLLLAAQIRAPRRTIRRAS